MASWRRTRLVALAAVALVAICRPATAEAQALANCKVWKVTGVQTTEKVPDKPGVTHDLIKGDASGNVEIICDDLRLYADELERYSDSDWIFLRGHVLLQEPTIRINAASGRVNRLTHLGTFNQVSGTVVRELKPGETKAAIEDPDVIFSGESLEKVGPKKYKLTHGQITTCTQPTPRWDLGTSTAVITPGENVVVTNMVLRVKSVPLFYLPALYFPINKEGRSTGVLPPSFGSSSLLGFDLQNAFFWAIDRSQDATFTHDWYKKAGNGFTGEYEYAASPSARGQVSVKLIDQHETDAGSVALPAQKSYFVTGNVNQSLPNNFNLIGSTNYTSSVTSQQLYQQNLADLATSQSYLQASVSGNVGRYRLSVGASRSDYLNGSSPAQRTGALPDIQFAIPDTPVAHTQIYFGMPIDTVYRLDQSNVDDPTTNRSLWRSDLKPTLRVPISSLPFLNVTSTASWELTMWSKSADPTNVSIALDQPIWRQVFTFDTTLTGPTFSRVFNTPDSGYSEKLKHVVEPSLTFEWVSPVHDLHPVQVDGTDYLVGGTTNITYGLTNHLLARRKTKDGTPGQSSEILNVKITQTYSTNAQAAAANSSYTGSVFNPTTTVGISNFTPVALTVNANPSERLNGTFYLNYDTFFHGIASLGASSRLTDGTVQLSTGWSKTNVIDGNPQGFEVGGNNLNFQTAFRPADKKVGASYEFSWNIAQSVLVEQRAQISYNSQCCGISFNYQQLQGFGTFKPDRRFGVSISLAGLGSLSNPSTTGDNSAIR
jgi:LPS-assembly protein